MSPDRHEQTPGGTRHRWLPGAAGGTAGFVLIESLVALAVAALLLTMLSRSFLSIWHGTTHAREDLQAMMIARTVMENASPRSTLEAGVKTGTTGGYAWRAETLPSSTRTTTLAVSGLPADQQLDVAPEAGQKWKLYRVLVTVGSPSGRRVVLEAFRLGA